MKRCRSARQISGPAPASPGAALDSNLRPWSWQERGSSLAGVGAGAHPLWEEEDDEGEEDGEEQGAGDEGVWLDWDRAVAAQLVHRPSHHAASNGCVPTLPGLSLYPRRARRDVVDLHTPPCYSVHSVGACWLRA